MLYSVLDSVLCQAQIPIDPITDPIRETLLADLPQLSDSFLKR